MSRKGDCGKVRRIVKVEGGHSAESLGTAPWLPLEPVQGFLRWPSHGLLKDNLRAGDAARAPNRRIGVQRFGGSEYDNSDKSIRICSSKSADKEQLES